MLHYICLDCLPKKNPKLTNTLVITTLEKETNNPPLNIGNLYICVGIINTRENVSCFHRFLKAFVYFKINLIKCNNYDKDGEKIGFSLR